MTAGQGTSPCRRWAIQRTKSVISNWPVELAGCSSVITVDLSSETSPAEATAAVAAAGAAAGAAAAAAAAAGPAVTAKGAAGSAVTAADGAAEGASAAAFDAAIFFRGAAITCFVANFLFWLLCFYLLMK